MNSQGIKKIIENLTNKNFIYQMEIQNFMEI